MIFVGDIALPYKDAITVEMPIEFYERKWFGNLEGSLIEGNKREEKVVYNNVEAIRKLIGDFNFVGFALANNHILDGGEHGITLENVKDIGLGFCGLGGNIKEANAPLYLLEEESKLIVINFGWEVIQCRTTYGDYAGVNPLLKEHVLQTVAKLVRENPQANVLPFMHWSYELESEPQPFERELAFALIDLGAVGVIGCHPHRIGGFECYKGKPIVYSLGNWMFMQGFYHNGKLRFPEFCNTQLAFELNLSTKKWFFHFFEFDRITSSLIYNRTEEGESGTMKRFTPFEGLSNREYKIWYKKNRYHKRKGLPIYYWEDSRSTLYLKNKINKLRDSLLSIYLKLK